MVNEETTEIESTDEAASPVDVLVMPLDVPWNKLPIVTIEALSDECGMFYDPIGSGVFGRNGCKSAQNIEGEGLCYSFTCPLADEMDNETPGWNEEEMDKGEYMLQHSKFAEA